MVHDIDVFLSGAFTAASAAIALFYVRYFRRTRDRLFAVLAVAFVMLGFERAVLAFIGPVYEGRHIVYLVRLAAFVLIIVAVADKNWPRRARRGSARRVKP